MSNPEMVVDTIRTVDLDAIKKLFDDGIITDVNATLPLSGFNTVLSLASTGPYKAGDTNAAKSAEVVRWLLGEKNADPNIPGGKGKFALHYSIEKEFLDATMLLLEYGADPSVWADDQQPFNDALRVKGFCLAVKKMLSMKPELATNKERPPLHTASGPGDKDIFHALVEAGADVTAVNDDGLTVAFQLCESGHTELLNFVLANGGTLQGKEGQTSPILAAALGGHADIVQICMDNGLPFDAPDAPGGGVTPVMLAAAAGHIEVVKLLAAKGALLDRVDDEGENLWHKIGSHGRKNEKIIPFLQTSEDYSKMVVGPGTVNLLNAEGRAPIHIACEAGNSGALKALLQLDACDASLLSKDGRNVWDFMEVTRFSWDKEDLEAVLTELKVPKAKVTDEVEQVAGAVLEGAHLLPVPKKQDGGGNKEAGDLRKPHPHPLVPGVRQTDWICDRCETAYPKGTIAFGCAACGYYQCPLHLKE